MTISEIKALVAHSPEYDFLRTNPHLGNNIILLGLGGSHAYGTNVEGSDVDLRGIAVNSKRDILLGKDFEQVVNSDTDTTIYSCNKILSLLTECNPNTLEILFQKPEHFLYVSEAGKLLVENKHLFITKRCIETFGGYARQQLRRIENKSVRSVSQARQEEHILNSIANATHTFKRKYSPFTDDEVKLYVDKTDREGMEAEIFMDISLTRYPLRDYEGMWGEMHNIVKEYGRLGKRGTHAFLHDKINKHAMHLVRLMMACITILDTGTFCTYCEDNHDLLMDIRNGKYLEAENQLNKEFFDMVECLEADMHKAYERTSIPDGPDYDKVAELLYSINERVVAGA